MADSKQKAVSTIAVAETAAAIETGLGSFGKYELTRHLATGGMAEIYLAEQVGPEGFSKQIVIKRILPHLARDAAFTAMFLDEARIAANLNHPNIGQIHELGDASGDYYIAMEFIDGASLAELVDAKTPIPHDVAARIVVDVLQALDFAHESKDRAGQPLGIVHRDVTPSNIMVSVDGIVKLVDFGVAKAAKKGHKTETGAVKGKFAYMAPEQIESQDIDRRADVFAIGIVLFELLTGEKPFGEDLAAVSRILHDEVPDPRDIDAGVPEQFAQVVLRALQKSADARYPTAHTMRLDLETALRLQNSYAGPREISQVVRRFRGEEIDEAPLSTSDTGVFAADRSAELSTQDVAFAETRALEVTPSSPETPKPPTTDTKRKVEIPFKPIAIGAVAVVALASLGGIASLVASSESPSSLVTSEPRTIVLNERPLVAEGAKPEALLDNDGELVVIDSVPPTQIYKGSKFIGWTPHQTTLSAGKHRIELALGDEKKRTELDVEKSRVNRFEFDFAALGEKDEDKKSKRKKRRRSLGSKIRSLF